MKSLSLALLTAALFAACSNPSPACPTPEQTLCSGNGTQAQNEDAGLCVDLQSDAKNCGSCGTACATQQTCQAGKCSSSVCLQPDVYATCWVGGGVVGICSETGAQTPTAIVAPGPGGQAVVPNLMGGVFSGASLLWLLDNANNQIDVSNVGTWPPISVATISAATSDAGSDTGFSVTQLVSCDGMVLALRTATPLLEGYNPATFAFVNEVSLASDAGSQFPYAVACDGDHTAYVTDSMNNTVTAVDLDTFQVTAQASLPAADHLAPISDGGLILPSLSAVAFAEAPAGGEVLVSLENIVNTSYAAVDPSTTFELDPTLATWSSPIDPGAQCLDVWEIAVSPDQSTAYLACAGMFDTANATSVQPYNPNGYVGVVAVGSQTAKAPIVTTLSNPTSLAFLGNGLLAIGDYTSQSEVAFYNPADGGISYVHVNCPLLPDGGLDVSQGVTGLIAGP